MRVKIYQIEDEKDTQNVKFRSFDETMFGDDDYDEPEDEDEGMGDLS